MSEVYVERHDGDELGAPQIPGEMVDRVTAYMREWWSRCDRTEREHGTGIQWLADHVLHVAGVPDLLAKVAGLRAEIVWLNRRNVRDG